MFPVLAGNSASTGYNPTRSLRFRASASATLSRTPASNGNRNTWTWSSWVKRGALGSGQRLFGTSSTGTSDTSLGDFFFSTTDKIGFFQYDGTTTYTNILSTQVFRDPSAWYHIVLVYDDTQATAANRVKIYVNGVQITAFDTAAYPTQNFTGFFNGAQPHIIGRYTGAGSGFYYDGYLTEINFVNAQALTPSSFGSTNTLTGVWQPAPYTGSYGTNGFVLDFEDNSALTTSSNVGLGKDTSGNGNYWVTNNISITAGVTYDSMTDVPTLTSATAANFAVLNPLINTSVTGFALTNGNLTFATTNTTSAGITFNIPTTGKWYWEATVVAVTTGVNLGIYDTTYQLVAGANPAQSTVYGYGYDNSGSKLNNGSAAYGASYTANDVIGVAFDAGAGTLTFYKNNTSQGTAFTGLTGKVYSAYFAANSSTWAANFGQRPFFYTPPTGFVALNTYNLPTSTILKGSDNMNIALAAGASIKANTEALFTGQFLEWIKDRANANNHQLLNGVTGLSAVLQSNTTAAETTYSAPSGNSVGFAWKAGSSSSSNTSGTITSTVSVNASAGFSVVTYTGTGANATVGHGLGVAPQLVIVKRRSSTGDWCVYSLSAAATYGSDRVLFLNTTDSATAAATVFNSSSPTSSVINIGTNPATNASGGTYVAYCWTPIAGYSAFGAYSGNASTDGPFVYCGFQPKFVMVKRTDSTGDWFILDAARDTYDVATKYLSPNLSAAEATTNFADFLSNGFKLRTASTAANGTSMIYAAFATNPFKNSLAF